MASVMYSASVLLVLGKSTLIPIHIIPSFLATARLSPPQCRTLRPSLLMQILHLSNSHSLRLPHALCQNHHLVPIRPVLPQLLPQRCFDPLPYLYVVLSDHADRMPALPGTCRPANSVYIGFRVVGEIEIEDYIHGGYIQAPSRNVRGDEYVSASGAELAQRT